MTRISRKRKPNYGDNRISNPPKTSRIEMRPETRAFVVGAVVMGNASANVLAATMGQWGQTTISKAVRIIKRRAEDSGLPLWDPQLYQTDIGRGREEILSQEQKERIIAITTQDHEHCEKEPLRAIRDGDYDDIPIKISITTLENVMYAAGYIRRRPSTIPKPPPTSVLVSQRSQWFLAHPPSVKP